VSDLEEFEMVKSALVSFESSSDGFHLSPDINEGFRVSRTGDSWIFEISYHEIEFGAYKEINALLEMPRILPPMFLDQGISFGYRLCLSLGEVENTPELFFKEEDLFYRSSLIDLDHLRDEEVFFFGPSIHMFQKTPFHLPDLFSVKSPAISFERLSKLDQSIFEVVPEPLHDMEVVVLEGGFGPYFADDFGEGGPEVENNAVGLDAPVIELSEKLCSDAPAVEPGDGFEIEDSDFNRISSDLFVSTSSLRHVFIETEGSRELELAEDLGEIVLGGETLFPSMQGRWGPSGIETPGKSLGNSFQGAIVLNDSGHGF
jgi:hypothetical protein